MCEYFFKRSVPMRRTVQFSHQKIGRDLSDIQIGSEDLMLGAHYIAITSTPGLIVFPDDFIKVGDV